MTKEAKVIKFTMRCLHLKFVFCRQVSDFDCFDVTDRHNSHFRLQLKEAMHRTWKKPILNKKVKHSTLTISV